MSSFYYFRSKIRELLTNAELDEEKLSECVVKWEEESLQGPQIKRALERSEMIKRLYRATRFWVDDEAVFMYIFRGLSVRDILKEFERVGVSDIGMATIKTRVKRAREEFDKIFVDIAQTIEIVDLGFTQVNLEEVNSRSATARAVGSEDEPQGFTNIVTYLWNDYSNVDLGDKKVKEVVAEFRKQLSDFEYKVYKTHTVYYSLKDYFDIDMGKKYWKKGKPENIDPTRFRIFMNILRPYSKKEKEMIQSQLYKFTDYMAYMEYLRTEKNLTEEERELRRELVTLLDGHYGASVLDIIDFTSIEAKPDTAMSDFTFELDEKGRMTAKRVNSQTNLDKVLTDLTDEHKAVDEFFGFRSKDTKVLAENYAGDLERKQSEAVSHLLEQEKAEIDRTITTDDVSAEDANAFFYAMDKEEERKKSRRGRPKKVVEKVGEVVLDDDFKPGKTKRISYTDETTAETGTTETDEEIFTEIETLMETDTETTLEPDTETTLEPDTETFIETNETVTEGGTQDRLEESECEITSVETDEDDEFSNFKPTIKKLRLD